MSNDFMNRMQAMQQTTANRTNPLPMNDTPGTVTDIAKTISSAADQSQRSLGLVNSFKARWHESKEVLNTHRAITTERETAIQALAKDAINAQCTLIREKLKLKHDVQYGVLAEQSLASQSVIQANLFSIVDAAADSAYEYLVERLHELEQRLAGGRISQAIFESELARAFRDAERKVKSTEADCDRKVKAVYDSFHRPSGPAQAY